MIVTSGSTKLETNNFSDLVVEWSGEDQEKEYDSTVDIVLKDNLVVSVMRDGTVEVWTPELCVYAVNIVEQALANGVAE